MLDGMRDGLTQEEATQILGICERTFRWYIDRYEENGLVGLSGKRLTQASCRRAPVDEVMAVAQQYERRYRGWIVKHFYGKYRDLENGVTRGSRTLFSRRDWFPRRPSAESIGSRGSEYSQ